MNASTSASVRSPQAGSASSAWLVGSTEMEDILAIILIFGGFTAFMLSISPVGKAVAYRIRSGDPGSKEALDKLRESQVAVLEELDQVRQELAEVQERVDFTERLLARQRDVPRLSGEEQAGR